MIHRMIRLQKNHIVLNVSQLQHIRGYFLPPHEKYIRNFRHLRGTDRLQITKSCHQQHITTIQRKHVTHQIAGKSALHIVLPFL